MSVTIDTLKSAVWGRKYK